MDKDMDMDKDMEAYKSKMEKKALEVIAKNNLTFISDAASFLGVSRATFYNWGFDKLDSIKDAIFDNRVKLKKKLKDKWEASDSAVLQMGLMKLICTEEEAHRLNATKQEVKNTVIDHSKILDELESKDE